MKRPVKLFIFLVLMILIVIIGEKIVNKEEYKQQLINEEGPRIEKFLQYNYENFKSVTFEDVEISPTGIPHIQGFVNDNPELKFDASVSREQFNAGINWNDERKRLAPKFEYELKAKTVDEIEKEEQFQNKATQ